MLSLQDNLVSLHDNSLDKTDGVMNYRGVPNSFHAYYVKPLHKRSVLGHEHQALYKGTGVS